MLSIKYLKSLKKFCVIVTSMDGWATVLAGYKTLKDAEKFVFDYIKE